MKRLWVIFSLIIGCVPVMDTYFEPEIKKSNQEIIYSQGIPVVLSKLPSSIMATYLLKTTNDEFRVFVAGKNLSEERIIFSYENIKSVYETTDDKYFAKSMSPKEVIIKKVQMDRFEMALLAVNSALQSTKTVGTVGEQDIDITTTSTGIDAGDIYLAEKTAQRQLSSTTSLKNSLLQKNTVFPNSIVSGFVFLEELRITPNQSTNRRGQAFTDLYRVGSEKITSVHIRIGFGNDYHQFLYHLPTN